MITLYGHVPAWGIPDLSPFVTAIDLYRRDEDFALYDPRGSARALSELPIRPAWPLRKDKHRTETDVSSMV